MIQKLMAILNLQKYVNSDVFVKLLGSDLMEL